MRVYDAHAEYTSLCRQKRPSAVTIHLPIWHADVRPFILCRTNHAQRNRVWHLFPSLWIPDLLYVTTSRAYPYHCSHANSMQRLREGGKWSLFDPADVPLLLTTHGEEFTAAYEFYERGNSSMDTTSAIDLWNVVCRAQQESGTPFVMYQDSINGKPIMSLYMCLSCSRLRTIAKNNHSHLGIIQSSNLCTEIVQFCSTDQTAVCTLASLSLPRFVLPDHAFDLQALHDTTELATLTTNAFVDHNDYPTDAARRSALDTRALGIGTQGLADTFMACNYPFDSTAARVLNREIFETIYHAAYQTSCALAEQDGPYPLYAGSPAARGILQHDMWQSAPLSGRNDFDSLRQRIAVYGLRNSMLTAQMPTASTAKLLGNFDSVEPYTRCVPSTLR